MLNATERMVVAKLMKHQSVYRLVNLLSDDAYERIKGNLERAFERRDELRRLEAEEKEKKAAAVEELKKQMEALGITQADMFPGTAPSEGPRRTSSTYHHRTETEKEAELQVEIEKRRRYPLLYKLALDGLEPAYWCGMGMAPKPIREYLSVEGNDREDLRMPNKEIKKLHKDLYGIEVEL